MTVVNQRYICKKQQQQKRNVYDTSCDEIKIKMVEKFEREKKKD